MANAAAADPRPAGVEAATGVATAPAAEMDGNGPAGTPGGGRRARFGWHGLGRARRIAALVLIGLAALVSLLCVLLVVSAWLEDASINARTGRATAEVVSVAFNRTVVRFDTPDGAVRIPPDGVLYPEGLEQGQLVRVEYDTNNPDLVRVAGRGAYLTYLPAGSTLLGVWAVVLPGLWWLRRPSRAS
ncbi:hypothetical protein GTS_10640 [Gandjariella thermophila]|uniref:DUF3592 domain-containing protein n=1 Tax=Gandjariella thermophila TaxID=1931992 RepID=A0A4D4IYV5_9PSEU|nr:hypothetical protein GTS_10640 [Gandjariella thermophila]